MSTSKKIFGDDDENANENEPNEPQKNQQNVEIEYKPSLSTGVYGLYMLQKPEEENKQTEIDKDDIKPPAFKVFKWGKIVIERDGSTQKFKDCIIKPDGAISWNWKLDGTRHNPGITVAAVENNKLLEEVDIVILTKGVNNVLQTKQETIEYVENAVKDGKIEEYHRLQSDEAVAKYKELVANGKRVSGLFHSTC